jgi:predicted nuclease of predicted toxin-antitoxin system
MKILLDESLPHKLRNDFGAEHEVWTVRDQGWLGNTNGELLILLVEAKFELFVTVDRNLRYQQNLEWLPLTVIILCAKDNRRDTLKALIPKIFERLMEEEQQNVIEIS